MNLQNTESPWSLRCTSIKKQFQRGGTKYERNNTEQKLNSIYNNFMEAGTTFEYQTQIGNTKRRMNEYILAIGDHTIVLLLGFFFVFFFLKRTK